MNLVQQEELNRQLMDAVWQGNVDQAMRLIEAGADVNQANLTGWTPLHEAVGNGHIDMVRFLLERGARINKRDNEGIAPLYYAAMRDEEEVVRLLIENGANINIEDSEGMTPLYRAAFHGQERRVRILIENKADINKGDSNGETPLHVAAFFFHEEIVELLIKNGADVNRENSKGKVPLDYAIEREDIEIAELVSGHITRLKAKGLYVSEKNLQLRNQVMSETERSMLLLCDNHKPLIDALPQLGYYVDEDDTPDEIRTFLEENRARFEVKCLEPGKSLIDFIDFEDNKTLHIPTLKLCAAVLEVVKNNSQLSNPSAEQLQGANLAL